MAKIFNNAKMTKMMDDFARKGKGSADLIMKRIYPLIDAAISKRKLFALRDDLRQECALKVFQALPKYSKRRGTAFAFLWTVIYNTLSSYGAKEWKGKNSIASLSLKEVFKEAELATYPFSSDPKHKLAVKELAEVIGTSVKSLPVRRLGIRKQKKVLKCVIEAVLDGSLFSERAEIISDLKDLGLPGEDIKFLIDYSVVTARIYLSEWKEHIEPVLYPMGGPNSGGSDE